MAERFPPGHGPKCGNCPDCGKILQIDWRCTILAEYHCTGCGRVFHNYMGVRPKISRDDIKPVIDELWNQIGEKEVDANIFIKLVDQVMVKASKTHIPVISKKDLARWGYTLEYGMLKKR
jgi:hypothetical protein